MNDDNNSNNDIISNSLDITPLQTNNIVKNLEAEAHDDSAIKDFENARANIYTMVETAKDAINNLAQIADSSQQPRAYEVLAKLIDTTLTANKSLLDLQEKIRQIKDIESPHNDKAKTINNNLFVGSTSELQKILKDMNNGSV
jgi:hypothetical protein